MAGTAIPGRLNWQTATVVSNEVETPRIHRLILDAPAWSAHISGQHLIVRLTAEDGYSAQRSYSIASAPESSQLHLIVEGLVDGEVSPYLTQEVRAGDQLELRGPIGRHFIWSTRLGGPLQMIGAGSGVAPFLAMLDHRERSDEGRSIPARLLYSARNYDDIIDRDHLLGPGDTNLDVTIALTRGAPAGWRGPTQRLDTDALKAYVFAPEDNGQFFVCGPNRFVEAITSALVQLGHPATAIKTERYGGA